MTELLPNVDATVADIATAGTVDDQKQLLHVYPPGSSQQVAPTEQQALHHFGWSGSPTQPSWENKALEFCLAVSPLIWGAETKIGEWPFYVKAAVNSIGMNYSKVIEDINANPDKYDAVWQQNQIDFQMTGQGGVPTMSWNGEPFFGQDRFGQFFWRLRENGLTKRKAPREPIVARPLRWPSSPGGE